MIESDIMPTKYVGMDRFKARKAVVADIDAEGLLIRVEDKKIMQPYGDRADKLAVEAKAAVDRGHASQSTTPAHPVEKRGPESQATDTNALDPDFHRDERDEGKGQTRFIPETWKKTYDNWMDNIQPWCISRQLWWGHQIPAWYGPDGHIFVGLDVASLDGQVKAHYGPSRKPIEAILTPGQTHQEYQKRMTGWGDGDLIALVRDPDVLDTWFSSGLWPFSTLGWPEKTDELARFYPTSTLVTAFDIIFFWVARMMMQGLHFMDEVPFKDVYIRGGQENVQIHR